MRQPTYSAEQSRQQDFCTWCPRLCHFSCPAVLGDASEGSSAWGLMSLARHERTGHVALDESVAHQWFHCASCGRCGDFCRHEHDVPDVMRVARQRARNAGLVPHEVDAVLEERAPRPSDPTPLPRGTGIALHLSCSTRASWPAERVDALVALVERLAGAPVARLEHNGVLCCGALGERAGDDARGAELRHHFRFTTRAAELVLTDCAGTEEAMAGQGAAPVQPIVSWLAERAGRLSGAAAHRGRVTLHGGCRERRVWALHQDEVRLLEAVGYGVDEAFCMEGSHECCGGDAVYAAAAADGAARAARALRRGASADDDQPFVTSRAACAAHVRAHADAGARSVLELVLDAVTPCAAP